MFPSNHKQVCNDPLEPVWDDWHVPHQCILLQSCQQPMWIVLTVCRVSKGRVPICSVWICVCSIVFQGVVHQLTWLWQAVHALLGSNVDAAVRCCLFSELMFFDDFVRDAAQYHLDEFRPVQSAKVSWGKSWRCSLPWNVCLSWRWRFWRASWPLAFPWWGWRLRPDIWFCLLQQWIVFDWVQPFWVLLYIQIAHM